MIMKKFIFLPIYYILTCALIPMVITAVFPADTVTETAEPNADTVAVFNHMTKETVQMDEGEYLTHVLAAEMPASFEPEALKAQAVAARTYVKYRSGSEGHDADICTDSTHCQAYLNEDEMRAKWGAEYDFYYNRLKTAVEETKGKYLTYESEPVMAVFHSMGGGRTENSADVWGKSVPYLVSVDSPGEESATNYNSSVTMTFDEFKAKILSAYPKAVLNSPMDVSVPVLTDGGHVKSIIIGGVSIAGTEMRTLFNLRSTMFSIAFADNNVTFSVTGYGHGVGMSQYGANAMAKNGSTYEEILAHYYPGTSLEE